LFAVCLESNVIAYALRSDGFISFFLNQKKPVGQIQPKNKMPERR
jgi:hypothetical protein